MLPLRSMNFACCDLLPSQHYFGASRMHDINHGQEQVRSSKTGYILAGLLVLALIAFTIYFVSIPSPLPPQ
ncbi:hypothetical protein ACFPQ7_09970 [Methylobacterium iners]|uniref:Uncharacterized protein n=1 Tax=Methylobacterium iners TaxID=418707 RepID=A0ABQ4S110_9HYPH|nr:hypothetical protein OCOJLMKI_3336 [Methylobacterium iners]